MLNLGMNLQRLAAKQVEFTPASLFNKGEAGVWYDPSAASGSLDWRKNLLEYTEQFDNSYWTKGGSTSVSAGEVDPNGGSTAFKYNISTPTGRNVDIPDNVITSGKTYTFSLYVKAITNTIIKLRQSGNAAFDEDVSITTAQGWQRISLTFTANSVLRVGFYDVSGSTGDRFYIWGAQLEEASTASSYQPILSTFENAFKTAFPSHTLYQDSQGVTPVTAVGEPVGLMLDKSKGLAQGPEQVTNGDFSNGTTGWTAQTGWAIANGVATCSSGSNYLYQLTGIPANTWVTATVEITDYTSGTLRLGSTGFAPTQFFSGLGKHSITFKTWASVGGVELRSNSFVGSIDNVSVKEIQGSHATQPTSTKRPIYARHPEGGIRNLLNYTEQFDNGYWAKTGVTVTPNTTIAPDGTQTADTAVFANTYGSSIIRDYVATLASTYTFSFYAKASSAIQIGARVGSANTSFTLSTEWQRFTFSASVTADANTIVEIRGGVVSGVTAQIWGAQLEEAAEASNYQKRVTDIDVTESGVGEVYYLKFDGVDDSMSINSLTSPSTPLTALFGYSATNAESTTFRWLLDIETGRTIFGASGNTAGRVGYYDGGTAWRQIDASINADAIKVLTYDLVANNAKMRVDGTQEYSDTSYIQRSVGGLVSLFSTNAGDNQFLAGNMYQTILRAAESTDEEIAKAETYVANKTGLKAQVDGIATLDLNFGANLYTAKNSNGGVI